ncbi:MAG: hypothetical protein B2I17_08850 [Thermoplasmatales archaeon B_DKE]|nr:MAG: hypothetical protein B2I17_08850 [Thermoplasmatales archaeon B_DKE]
MAQRFISGKETSLICGIEEPETSLHTGAQKVLLDSMKTLTANGVQIIYTTHSPVFVSELSNENTIIMKNEGLPGQAEKRDSVPHSSFHADSRG